MTENKELGWNDEIDVNADDYILLPPGEYDFTVATVEKARHELKQGGKLPACNKAIIHCIIDQGDKRVTIKNNLFLHTSCMSMLAQFFKSIGQRQSGEKIKMNWQTVPGSTGRCVVKNREYNGSTFNEIGRFIEPKQGFESGTF